MEEILQFEEWRPVVGYEGLYEVSSFGRVRSLDKYKKQWRGGKIFVQGRIMQPKTKKNGYLGLILSKNGKQKNVLIHRLVAKAFIPNPHNLPCVNHKTECKTFNHFSALEWCDVSYNTKYGSGIKRTAEKLSKPIVQLSLNGNFIKKWESATVVERELGFFKTHITKCCRGKLKSAYGFKWEYADNNEQNA